MHPASYSMGASSFPGAKAARGMAVHLQLVPRLRMSRVTPSPLYAFMACTGCPVRSSTIKCVISIKSV